MEFDEDDEHELQELMARQFEAVQNDPKMVRILEDMQRRVQRQSLMRNERRNVFLDLVRLGVIYSKCPFEPDLQLGWMLMVLNNAYTVPLPDDNPQIYRLAVDFIQFYTEDIPRPSWIPESYATPMHEKGGACTGMAITSFPVPPEDEEMPTNAAS